ncbi:hypothetical protein ABK040_008782 [Willaertia magna]
MGNITSASNKGYLDVPKQRHDEEQPSEARADFKNAKENILDFKATLKKTAKTSSKALFSKHYSSNIITQETPEERNLVDELSNKNTAAFRKVKGDLDNFHSPNPGFFNKSNSMTVSRSLEYNRTTRRMKEEELRKSTSPLTTKPPSKNNNNPASLSFTDRSDNLNTTSLPSLNTPKISEQNRKPRRNTVTIALPLSTKVELSVDSCSPRSSSQPNLNRRVARRSTSCGKNISITKDGYVVSSKGFKSAFLSGSNNSNDEDSCSNVSSEVTSINRNVLEVLYEDDLFRDNTNKPGKSNRVLIKISPPKKQPEMNHLPPKQDKSLLTITPQENFLNERNFQRKAEKEKREMKEDILNIVKDIQDFF